MRDARAVMRVGVANPQWRGKRSRHSLRMRNPQLYVSGKRPTGMSRVLLGFIEYMMLFLHRKRRQAMPQYRLDYHALSEIQVFGM